MRALSHREDLYPPALQVSLACEQNSADIFRCPEEERNVATRAEQVPSVLITCKVAIQDFLSKLPGASSGIRNAALAGLTPDSHGSSRESFVVTHQTQGYAFETVLLPGKHQGSKSKPLSL